MIGYLSGWQRKLGLVTLAMTFVFLSGWIRSQYVVDWIAIGIDNKSLCQLTSSHQRILIQTTFDPHDPPLQDGRVINWGAFKQDHQEKIGSIEILDLNESDVRMVLRIWTVSYWMIVIPLMLLSVSLLLTRRKSA